MATVEQARRALGDRLRSLRRGTGMTGADFAARAGWPASKVSKLELGHQIPTPADISIWCAQTGGERAERDLQADLANLEAMVADSRRAARASLTGRQERRAELDRRASRIRVFGTWLVPPPLQTEDYLRGALTQSAGFLGGSAVEIAEAVAAQLRRQENVITSGQQIEVLLADQALHTTVTDIDTTRRQLEYLLDPELSRASIGIIPRDAVWMHAVTPMTIYDDIAITETVVADMELTGAAGLAVVNRVWDALVDQAVTGEAARKYIRAALAR
ncbi:Scr1 family TA system antitoxin-like transcriptional regulator [Nocardia tengchongensis]